MGNKPFISVIIPAFNEAESIGKLLDHLKESEEAFNFEVLVADGGSNDRTIEIAKQKCAFVLECPEKGRALQMNYAAAKANGSVLYFVHADTLPPKRFVHSIKKAIDKGYLAGCFRFKFIGGPLLLKVNAYCTRFKGLAFRGGDQSLFIDHSYFNKLGGYDEKFVIMEEYDLIRTIMNQHDFYIIPEDVMVSSRKYRDNGYFKINIANYMAMRMFMKKIPSIEISNMYRSRLKKLR